MEGGHHLRLSECRASNVIGCSQSTYLVGAGILVIETHQITRVEVDHSTSRSRCWLTIAVESVPPRRDFRWRRKARVYRGSAKKGFEGGGAAGTIFAIRCPRSVTNTSLEEACRTHRPVSWCNSRIVMVFM